MIEGIKSPDIVKEGKACLFVLFVFACAAVAVAAVFGLCWLLKQAILALC
jgi:type III secretory pathway component EscS